MSKAGRLVAALGVTVLIAGAGVVPAAAASGACEGDPTGLSCLSEAWSTCEDTYSVETETAEWVSCHTIAAREWVCPVGSECYVLLKDVLSKCPSVDVCRGLLELIDDLLPVRL